MYALTSVIFLLSVAKVVIFLALAKVVTDGLRWVTETTEWMTLALVLCFSMMYLCPAFEMCISSLSLRQVLVLRDFDKCCSLWIVQMFVLLILQKTCCSLFWLFDFDIDRCCALHFRYVFILLILKKSLFCLFLLGIDALRPRQVSVLFVFCAYDILSCDRRRVNLTLLPFHFVRPS